MRVWPLIAGLNGTIAVALGAYAAHGLVHDAYAQSLAQQASSYQLLHAIAVLAISAHGERLGRGAWIPCLLLTLGTVLFSGSLTVRALTGDPLPIPLVTPAGGVCFLMGWASLALVALVSKK